MKQETSTPTLGQGTIHQHKTQMRTGRRNKNTKNNLKLN